MKTALVFPPQWFPSQPYLALPTLKGYLEARGHEVDQFDFNIESYDLFLSRAYLERAVEKVRRRLASPAYTVDEREAHEVYRQILADEGFLESILEEVEDAKSVLRDEKRFFQFAEYKRAYTTLKIAMKLV
ncbi:MAG: radical SAM protein, partial [Nitrospinaceae bacterium]